MPRISITEPGKDSQAYRFDMKRMKVSLGRSSSNDVKIEHRSVSKQHAAIERRKGGLVICDCESTNGVKLDGERQEEITLTNGMEVEVGDVSLEFSLSDEECDQLTEERFKAKREAEAAEEEDADEE
ncbi:FHA domain-containing protein [Verrucomicrobiaceae bacterium N1E253]|uniref:FHA domain-containing protein n=1 Tax=Oceaniferula marina TaxID=2748318 RepID=A0A851GDP8_9BACT|nr:FHA domain-containing protein [Oceaniferula marina]NWK55888.1 FHA domain-containing protein [Oceaniferula marina]